MGDAPAALIINFGATSGANTLIWDAAAGLNGPGGFSVQNFQQGLDTLEFGQFGHNGGFHHPRPDQDQRRRCTRRSTAGERTVVGHDPHAESER